MVAAHFGEGVDGRPGNQTLLDDLVTDVQIEIYFSLFALQNSCVFGRPSQQCGSKASLCSSGYRLKQEPTPADRIRSPHDPVQWLRADAAFNFVGSVSKFLHDFAGMFADGRRDPANTGRLPS